MIGFELHSPVTHKARKARVAAALIAALGAALCIGPHTGCTGGSATETTGGAKVTGQVVYPDGSAAANASLVVRPADFLADTSGSLDTVFRATARTDAKGFYEFDSIPSGDFVLVAKDAKGRAAMAEFRKHMETGDLERNADTLRAPGSLFGSLGPTDGATGAGFVQIFGLGRTLRADADGEFRFTNLPAGLLRLRALASRPAWRYGDTLSALVPPGDSVRVRAFEPVFDEDFAAWGSSRAIVLNTVRKTGGADAVDFPLLVRLTRAQIDFASVRAKEIRFADAKGRRLPYAIEQWDSAGGSAAVWVKLDTVRAERNDQAITMHWSRPGAPGRSDPGAVFSSFAAAWHLSDSVSSAGPSGFRDASPSAAHAVGTPANTGAASDRNGLIASGLLFQRAQSLDAGRAAALMPSAGLHLSAWIRMTGVDSLGGEIAGLGGNYGLRARPDGTVRFYLTTDTAPSGRSYFVHVGDSARPLSDSQWHMVTGTFDGTVMRIFLDGFETMSMRDFGDPLAYPNAGGFRIGAHGGDSAGYGFIGNLDEIQVSPKVRSSSWIKLAYENQRAGSTLLEFR